MTRAAIREGGMTLALPGPGRRVLARASARLHLFEADILSDCKTLILLRPRFAIILVMHELGWSGSRIGKLIGGRDSSTVRHGLIRAREMMEDDAEFRALVDDLRAAARDVTAFVAPPVGFTAAPRPVEAKPDPEEFELHTRRRDMAIGSQLLARAIREYRRAA